MPTTTTTTTRAKRYIRSDNPGNFQFTIRRLEINAEICRAGAIRYDHLASLHPDFPQHALYPTTQLFFDNGFCNRPGSQEELHRLVPGRLPTFITPDRWGARLHRAFFADPVAYPKYTYQNNPVTRASLNQLLQQGHISREDYVQQTRKLQASTGHLVHEINKTKTLLDYRLGARTVDDLTFFTESELWVKFAPNDQLVQPIYDINDLPTLRAHDFKKSRLENLSAPQSTIPLQLKTKIDWAVKLPGNSHLQTMTIPVTTQPDAYFAHQRNNNFKAFFLEHDEGTETILPGRNLRQSLHLFRETSLYQKLLISIAAFRHRAHVKQFGITSFSVIIITTTPERVDKIIDELAPLLFQFKIHPNFVLLTDQETLARHDNNPYRPDYIHLNLAGDYVHLLDV